ncbi:AraC family transcriptional regulator [Cyanobium sp. FGCU-6]|nr:AraC family transcriptional regulator [Cyanobium sp. FGCU6]
MADTARVLAGLLPLRRLVSLAGESAWWHRDGHLQPGPLCMAAWLGSPLRLEVDGHDGHWLLLQHQGVSRLEQHGLQHELRAGSGLILSGEPWVLIARSRIASGTLLPLDPAELFKSACRIHAERGAQAPFNARPLRSPQQVGGSHDRRGTALLASLECLLASICQLERIGDGLQDPLLFDRQLPRLLALLAFADLDEAETVAAGEVRGTASHGDDDLIEPLLDYIKANLDQPISLQLLEQRSHYSRRTLHNAFQQRFQCSPMQWVRQLRLAHAFARLSAPRDSDTVQVLARECGYRSTSQFSADFQRFQGLRPSELLRRARAGAFNAMPVAAGPPGPAPG